MLSLNQYTFFSDSYISLMICRLEKKSAWYIHSLARNRTSLPKFCSHKTFKQNSAKLGNLNEVKASVTLHPFLLHVSLYKETKPFIF